MGPSIGLYMHYLHRALFQFPIYPLFLFPYSPYTSLLFSLSAHYALTLANNLRLQALYLGSLSLYLGTLCVFVFVV